MAKPFSKPIQPGAKQGSLPLTSNGIFAGGTRGQRAAQVKPLDDRSMPISNSIDVCSFASPSFRGVPSDEGETCVLPSRELTTLGVIYTLGLRRAGRCIVLFTAWRHHCRRTQETPTSLRCFEWIPCEVRVAREQITRLYLSTNSTVLNLFVRSRGSLWR